MTNDTSIEPALTADQWDIVNRDRLIGIAAAVDLIPLDLHPVRNSWQVMAVANANLPDDDPRKFTWADYDMWNGRNPEAQIVADKIKALLPPR